jgi:hypothetical protein
MRQLVTPSQTQPERLPPAPNPARTSPGHPLWLRRPVLPDGWVKRIEEGFVVVIEENTGKAAHKAGQKFAADHPPAQPSAIDLRRELAPVRLHEPAVRPLADFPQDGRVQRGSRRLAAWALPQALALHLGNQLEAAHRLKIKPARVKMTATKDESSCRHWVTLQYDVTVHKLSQFGKVLYDIARDVEQAGGWVTQISLGTELRPANDHPDDRRPHGKWRCMHVDISIKTQRKITADAAAWDAAMRDLFRRRKA